MTDTHWETIGRARHVMEYSAPGDRAEILVTPELDQKLAIIGRASVISLAFFLVFLVSYFVWWHPVLLLVCAIPMGIVARMMHWGEGLLAKQRFKTTPTLISRDVVR